jgi:acetolactate synthase-1/2/3 large subunit
MKASDAIAKFLKLQGIDHVFELSGGMITHLLDSLLKEKFNIVTMHHEQAAAFAAEGFARTTRLPGVALATSGPGATNLLTGIASCYFDSVPALFITGQVNTYEQKGDKPIRQLGFQETDIVSMATPITKAAFRVTDGAEVGDVLVKAFELATTGRPGPVLVDLPMNVQRANVEWEPVKLVKDNSRINGFDQHSFSEIYESIKQSSRPLFLAGGGLRAASAIDEFRDLVKKTNVPTILSLMGVDALPYETAERVGFIGSYGNRWANMAIGKTDLIIVLGSRLDIRQTGADTTFFKGDRKIIHVDVDAGEINNRIKNCIRIVADLKDFLSGLNNYLSGKKFQKFESWVAELTELRNQWPDTNEIPDLKGINPNKFMHELSVKSGKAAAYITDVGNHQMWAAQSLEIGPGQSFLTSGGMGAMGFALPTSIGAALAARPAPVVLIAGDGGFQLNIQELQTIVRNKLPIKLIVLNNKALGMIRQFQDSYFEGRYQSTLWGYTTPDFEQVAKAYGIEAKTISEPSETEGGIEWLWDKPGEPALLQVMIDTFTNVYPKIAFGRPITEMEPFSKPVEMEGT